MLLAPNELNGFSDRTACVLVHSKRVFSVSHMGLSELDRGSEGRGAASHTSPTAKYRNLQTNVIDARMHQLHSYRWIRRQMTISWFHGWWVHWTCSHPPASVTLIADASTHIKPQYMKWFLYIPPDRLARCHGNRLATHWTVTPCYHERTTRV